jgi:cellulose biosynthesis protein BcsQ
VTAVTIGFTTPRSPACKRGVAVNFAASLARNAATGSRVCLVDADPFGRDATTRLAVPGPHLEEFADQHVADPAALVDALVSLHEPPLWVLPSSGGGVGATHRAVSRILPALREGFDVVVCDLVGGPSGPARVLSNRLDQLDWLVVAVTPEPRMVEAAARYVDAFDAARVRGHVAESVRIGVVSTGDEGSTSLGVEDVGALLGERYLGSFRQLWGRAVPNLGFGAALGIGELDDAVDALFSRLGRDADRLVAPA